MLDHASATCGCIDVLYSTWVLVNQDEVRSFTRATVETEDELDTAVVEVLLYYKGPVFDGYLDDDDDICVYQGSAVTCNALALHSPLSAGCEYCGDHRIRGYRSGQEVWNFEDTTCDTAPAGGGGGGGGGIP